MPCTVAARGTRSTTSIPPFSGTFTPALPFNDTHDNTPCGRKILTSVGGPIPGSISVEAGTPATVNVVAGVAPAPPPLVPVTWAAAGPRSLTEQVSNTLAGNAKLAIA